MAIPDLSIFGRRIMICGTSNTGKSTLAVAIGKKLGLPAIHLDQLRFAPNTDWVERPDPEFHSLHREAVAGDNWVMEGNYSAIIDVRIARATGIILLGDHPWANLGRYLRRTLIQRHERVGNLAGNRDSLKWEMVHWVLVRGPRSIARYRTMLPATGLPFLELRSMAETRAAYATWDLEGPR
jgi:adenylate kinase family enzyme